MTISTAGTTIENTTINGCITINANNVTITNTAINCNNTYPIKDNHNSGTTVRNVTIDCQGNGSKGIYFDEASNFTVDRIEITNCDDQLFIDGGLGNSRITNSVFHNQVPAQTAHTDGMHVGEFEHTTGTLTVNNNWWEYNRDGCCENAVLFMSSHSALTANLDSNYLDGDFGTHIIRCQAAGACNITNNTVNGTPDGMFIYGRGAGGTASCNRYMNGTLVPDNLMSDININNSSC